MPCGQTAGTASLPADSPYSDAGIPGFFSVLNDQNKAVSGDSGDLFDMMILFENHLGGLLRCSQISSHATSLQFLGCQWGGSSWEPAASK